MHRDCSIGFSGTLALTLLVISVSCATEADPLPRVDQAARYAKPLGYLEWMVHTERFRPLPLEVNHERRPDSWLLWRAEGKLLTLELDASRVVVDVVGQNVVLSGDIRDRSSADTLIESMKTIRGVAHIIDLMTIEPR